MSSEVKWSNLATADPLCACMIERSLREPSNLPAFMTEPLEAMIRSKYSGLYTENGECVIRGAIPDDDGRPKR